MSIEIQNLTKTFGAVQALDQVSFSLEEHRIYGLLGNNGAGKSTLLSILADRQRPSSGRVLVDGEDIANNDRALGKLFLVGEQNLFPDDMRVKTALGVLSQFYPGFDQTYAKAMAEKFGLPLKKKITALSTGYASIFRLILGLSVNTPYLFFDEPVLGLDAQHRDLFYRLLLEKYGAHPCTILISTHLIDEAAPLIEHTLILRRGKILKDSPTEALTANAFSVSGPAGAVDRYTAGMELLTQSALGGLKTVSVQGNPTLPLPLGLELHRLTLQDYFIGLQEAEDRRCAS